jgi:DNA-binding LacI/PurR family transcriptional regulator
MTPPADPSRVGIRDVAKAAAVSLMTVSLALRNNPKISAATRERVQRLAREIGYRPDPEIARLMTRLHGRKNTGRTPIAIVDVSPSRSASCNDYSAQVRAGAVRRARELGFGETSFHRMDYDGDLRRLLSVIRHRGIEGVLLLPPVVPVELDPFLDWSGLSVIAATYAITPWRFHLVVPNHFIDMCALLALLEARGFARIGAVLQDNFEARTHHQLTGAFALRGHTERILRVPDPQNLRPEIIASWLKEAQPDALICPFSAQLRAALPPKTTRNRPLPEIVSLRPDDVSTRFYWDELPGDIGADAATLLAGMMTHHETGLPSGPRTSMIHGRFVDRATMHSGKTALAAGTPA